MTSRARFRSRLLSSPACDLQYETVGFVMTDRHSPKNKLGRHDTQIHADLIDDDWPEATNVFDRPRRTWFLAALICIATAIAAEIVSKRYAGFSMMAMARAAQAKSDAKQLEDLGMDDLAQLAYDESARLKKIALVSPHPSVRWTVAGLGLLLLAIGCWSISYFQNERASSVWLAALFIFYLLLLMLMV
jgi:hypothetical protein